jgi:hypothetical protein
MEFANLVYNQGKKLKEEGVFEMPENLNVLQESIDVPEDQNIEEYFKNQVELEKDKQVLEDVKKKSWINKVGSIDLAKGSTSLGEMMFGIGETMYDLFAFPQNKLVQMGVLGDDWEVSSEEFKEKFGIENRLLEFYQKETEKLEKQQSVWNNENYDVQGIYSNFKEGNWADGFKQLGSGLAESAPVSISMMLGGAAASGNLVKLSTASTPFFIGPELERLRKEDPDAFEADLLMKSLGLAAAETVFSSIGTGTLGKVYKDILLKEGKEEGVKIFRSGLIQMYEEALKKMGAPAGALGEGIEEVATLITQNMINGVDPFKGVQDAFLQGLGGGTTYSLPINVAQVNSGIQDALSINKLNKSLSVIDKNYTVNDLTKVYDRDITTAQSVEGLEITQIKNTPSILDKQVETQVELGQISKEKGDQIRNNFRETTQAVNQLKPVGLNLNVEAVSLLKEKNELNKIIKSVDDKAVTQNQQNRVDEINDRLSEIVSEEKAAFEQEKAETVAMGIIPTRRAPRADALAIQYQQDPANVDVEALLDQYNKIGLAAIKF